jgi:hypothetical protein
MMANFNQFYAAVTALLRISQGAAFASMQYDAATPCAENKYD